PVVVPPPVALPAEPEVEPPLAAVLLPLSSSSLLLEQATTTNVVASNANPVAPTVHLRAISITSGLRPIRRSAGRLRNLPPPVQQTHRIREDRVFDCSYSSDPVAAQ